MWHQTPEDTIGGSGPLLPSLWAWLNKEFQLPPAPLASSFCSAQTVQLSQEPSASATSPTRGQISFRKNTGQSPNHKASAHLALGLGLAHLSSAQSEGKQHPLAQLTGSVTTTCCKSPELPCVT